MKKSMLEIKDLTCGYDSKVILRDINLSVEKGELVGIIGPNGSGKTTLLRAATGVLRPKKGRVMLEGKDISEIALKEFAKKVSVVSQAQALEAGAMNVEEFVLLGRVPHYRRFQFLETREDVGVVERCMTLTDILELKDQFTDQISGGERQRAVIARALAQEPALLLLDEPTAHLDISHKIRILDLIKRLNMTFALTVIMVLHDLNLASEYCDRIVLLDKGRISEMGSPQEVLNYKTIERVYNTVVLVKENPITGRPYVFLIPHSKK